MGVRAVIVVRDDSGREQRFWAAWASKQFQIPHLARFIHDTDLDQYPLTLAGYLACATGHPGTLPSTDITDSGGYADPNEAGDLDHRYELLLSAARRSFRFLVYDRDRHGTGWQRSHVLASRSQLYSAAGDMCLEMAINTDLAIARGSGRPPGWASPQEWRAEAATFLGWIAATDPDLLQLVGPPIEQLPEWFVVRTSRSQRRQIADALRQLYPGIAFRVRVGPGPVISLTVPADLAVTREAQRIAALVGTVCGLSFTAHVRRHRTRAGQVHKGQTATAHATVTLRPRDVAGEPSDTTPGDQR
jgi:hypothetical protein